MKKNVGTLDRIVRVILGFAIIMVGIVANSWWGLIGLIPIITALVGKCGLYVPLGISTCKVKQPK